MRNALSKHSSVDSPIGLALRLYPDTQPRVPSLSELARTTRSQFTPENTHPIQSAEEYQSFIESLRKELPHWYEREGNKHVWAAGTVASVDRVVGVPLVSLQLPRVTETIRCVFDQGIIDQLELDPLRAGMRINVYGTHNPPGLCVHGLERFEEHPTATYLWDQGSITFSTQRR